MYLDSFVGLFSSLGAWLAEVVGFLPVLVVGIVASLLPLTLVDDDDGDWL